MPQRALPRRLLLLVQGILIGAGVVRADDPPAIKPMALVAEPYSLNAVRLLNSPFTEAVAANRNYLLALDMDRLLAPFLRAAGLEARAPAYGNWEGSGLGGHTAGHYLSALSTVIASGADTPAGEFQRRLDYMVSELNRCQEASGDGYIGGVPEGRAFWKEIASGRIEAHGFGINNKWVPWYNLHKTFAGLRDAWVSAGNAEARTVLIAYGDWCVTLLSGLSDEQMQTMLKAEHGGMNEVLADIYAITGDERYLRAAQRFCHKAVLDPLRRHQDRLTGLHANTQIPKVVGLERIAMLTDDKEADSAARFFWDNVTGKRTVAFGGNSVSEHFNSPESFRGMIENREGPETCNTYNMLRLTGELFVVEPRAAYADYYERALYNHILASIHPTTPGYVYFTPIRPGHYRVYSQPDQCFWCCVGSGMENPGMYGGFIYSQAQDGLYVNLFIPSELTATNLGLMLRQETSFPDEPGTRLSLRLKEPRTFTIRLRHPGWVETGGLAVRVNGEPMDFSSTSSSYAALDREWHNGDRLEIELPMRTAVERLPDGSDWVAFLHGPIVLASPQGTNNLVGLRADDSRMGHVAHGPMISLDEAPVLLASAGELTQHIKPDPSAGPLRFRIMDVAEPAPPDGLPLMPFFRLHDQRYQMYWELTTPEGLAVRRERVAAAERARAELEARTLDWVAVGQQQPEVEHGFSGGNTETGWRADRQWRHGEWFQYALNTRGAAVVDLVVTYWGGERNREFDITVNGTLLANEKLTGSKPRQFMETHYAIPPDVLADVTDGALAIKFAAQPGAMTGEIYDVRLMRAHQP